METFGAEISFEYDINIKKIYFEIEQLINKLKTKGYFIKNNICK